MGKEKESREPSKPRLCERCGSRMPPQKRGRPRRWCSQQCRQSAYEERHSLESWNDKQPKVNDLSDVVEVMNDRAARREARRRQVVPNRQATHTSHECVHCSRTSLPAQQGGWEPDVRVRRSSSST